MALNEFFSKKDLEKILVCTICTNCLDTPKVLPCGQIICTACESVYFSSAQIKKCELCEFEHELPVNGFPVNTLVHKLLQQTPKNVYRGELHKNTMKSINNFYVLNLNFEKELTEIESKVVEYCDFMRNCIDIKRESAIEAIQAYSEKLMNQINEYKKMCIGKCGNIEEFKAFVNQSNVNYNNWVDFTCSAEIDDKEIDKVLKESSQFSKEFYLQKKKLDIHVFGTQKLKFFENECDINCYMIGTLKFKRNSNSSLINLLQNKPLFEINYKTETQAMSYYNTNVIRINEHEVCLAVSMSDNNNEYYYLKLKLFSNNGRFIKEISEQLIAGYTQFGATIIKDAIVIQAYSALGYYVLNSYNNDLCLIKTVNVKYYNSTLFTDDERLYIYSTSNPKYWTIYDDNLNQLESIAIGDGTSYPFISNDTSQVELKYGRLFIYYNQELRVVDNETRTIIHKIKLDVKYANQNTLVKPLPSEEFVIIDKTSKQAKIFDLDLECLLDFQIEYINQITSVSLTSADNIVICDNTATKVYLF